MAQFQLQDPDDLSASFKLRLAAEHDWPFQCSRIWDPVNARFAKCFLPVISAIPAAITVCILLIMMLRMLPLRTPRSLRQFVEEFKSQEAEELTHRRKILSRPAIYLFLTSILGLASQTAVLFYPSFQLQMAYPVASWVAACLLIVIQRPVTTPIALLLLYGSLFISQLVVLAHSLSTIRHIGLPLILVLLAALGDVAIIVNMPMRDPSLPSEEISPAFGPPTAKLRSPEDMFTLWQFMTVSWMAPLMAIGRARRLEYDDVWNLAYQFQHKYLHDGFRQLRGTLFKRLLDANGIDLVIITGLSLIELVSNFSAPVILQKILQTMQDPSAPKRAAVTYACMSLAIRLIASQTGVFSLWFSRRIYERSRGEMFTMVFEKSLTRKVVSISSKAPSERSDVAPANGNGNSNNVTANGNENGIMKKPDPSWREKFLNYLKKPFSRRAKTPPKKEAGATTGKVLSLLGDIFMISQQFWDFSMFITQPLGLIVSVYLIWRLIGPPCLFGVVTVIFAYIFQTMIARQLWKSEIKRRAISDIKFQKIIELVESIRHLRWYAWEDVWLARVLEARKNELNLRVITSLWNILMTFINTFASGMFPVVAFYAYTVWAGLPLRVDIAFPALQLFSMLETNLRAVPRIITILINTSISFKRMDAFMSEPDKAEGDDRLASTEIEMKNASFAWPGATEPVLNNITVSFPPGLTMLCGEVGAGKTALLQAMCGELHLLAGECYRSSEMVGYCQQTPWLQSMSIRENILFFCPYEEDRYNQILEACALVPDLANFKDGDLSMIGENGVGLSGGQKSRVALARAVYSNARLLFLDDPLSALDHQTAEMIVEKCLVGPLMKGRTVILVTHRTELCMGRSQQVVQISNGRAKVMDPKSSPAFVDLHDPKAAEEEALAEIEAREPAAKPSAFITTEHREHGDVKLRVYWEYIKAGKLKWWFVLICLLGLTRLVEVSETWFLKLWGEAYGNSEGFEGSILRSRFTAIKSYSVTRAFSTDAFWKSQTITQDLVAVTATNSSTGGLSSGLLGNWPSPEDDIHPWLVGFFVLAAAQSMAYLISRVFMIVIVYVAGKSMFERAMTKITHSTFRFYDITPVGRLMNRMTRDMTTVDGSITMQFESIATLSIAWVSSVVVIGSITPLFLVFAIILTICFVIVFLHFLPTSQSLRRLEKVTFSPFVVHFNTLYQGLATIRAFCVQSHIQDRVISVIDRFQGMDHFYWSVQTWLGFRFDNLSACSTFLLTLMALLTGVSPGLTAFLLTAASKFVTSTHAICKAYGNLQLDFTSVERVVEMLDLEEEVPGSVDPPVWWPSLGGDIVFENVTIKYAPHLDPSLKDISFTIKGGSTTALIGRTGSGKSTLAISLLATILPTSGRILIDNIDISTVNTQTLRRRVTFIAQEAMLFPGTMRKNLDPLDEYSDEECKFVLAKIGDRHQWTLDTHFEAGGSNISQGQRQLVGLARTLLRRSSIIIMDEATASIDMETAMQIQEIIRDEMKESTVITIAHRVEAVKGADYCIILANGEVVEKGEPNNMIARMEG